MTTATRNAATVKLQDVAVELGGLYELAAGYAERFGLKVVAHWDGTPALAQDDAATLVSNVREIRDEQSRKERAYGAYLEDRARKRTEAGTTAYATTLQRGSQRDREETLENAGDSVSISPSVRLMAGGATRTRAREAREQALNEFDRKHPVRELADAKWEREIR